MVGEYGGWYICQDTQALTMTGTSAEAKNLKFSTLNLNHVRSAWKILDINSTFNHSSINHSEIDLQKLNALRSVSPLLLTLLWALQV